LQPKGFSSVFATFPVVVPHAFCNRSDLRLDCRA
jgi:hypothetical protein